MGFNYDKLHAEYLERYAALHPTFPALRKETPETIKDRDDNVREIPIENTTAGSGAEGETPRKTKKAKPKAGKA